jgi:hypothetical protein
MELSGHFFRNMVVLFGKVICQIEPSVSHAVTMVFSRTVAKLPHQATRRIPVV